MLHNHGLNDLCCICIKCSIHIFINVKYLPVLFNNHWEIRLCWSFFTRPPPPPDPRLHPHPSPPSHNSDGWGCEEHQEAEPYPWWRRTWAELERELTEPNREDTPTTSSSPPVNQTVFSANWQQYSHFSFIIMQLNVMWKAFMTFLTQHMNMKT